MYGSHYFIHDREQQTEDPSRIVKVKGQPGNSRDTHKFASRVDHEWVPAESGNSGTRSRGTLQNGVADRGRGR
jgi:hypothetical protein